MNRRDEGPLLAALVRLLADYPDWRFAVIRGPGGPRLEGYRPGCPAGLVAVITADPAELRRELDADARQHPRPAQRRS